ncbi:calcineurin B homologous protein 1-like [Limulus polyphemus]|uniref:Calcineurin B homologous protein 1-like n=1 Tax=Limulus polyphemus TaxID=6850 RepID=A0ABM1SK50_LIMPO|nr:calcineurin B homologous protein 1-like [Limulus polyphemus]
MENSALDMCVCLCTDLFFSPVTKSQITRLHSRFTILDKGKTGNLRREDFMQIPELSINPLGDRIVQAFFSEALDDMINLRQFIRVLSKFQRTKENEEDNKLNSREEKLKFAFRMYDTDNDKKISRGELLVVLNMLVGSNTPEEQLASIADRTIIEADMDGDRMISFEEFCTSLERTDVEEKMSIRFPH